MIRFWPNGGTGIHKRLKISRPMGLRVRIPLRLPHYSPVAQLAEHLAVNQRVPGSSPGGGATKLKDYKHNPWDIFMSNKGVKR